MFEVFMNSKSLKPLIFGSALLILAGVASADDPPTTVPLTAEQAQARQFGILLGGTSAQYDVCAGKGFLPKGAQSAEDTATPLMCKRAGR
jgi:hypothetical protein